MPEFATARKDLATEFVIKDDSQLDAFAAIGAFLSGSKEASFTIGTVQTAAQRSAIEGLTLLNGEIAAEVLKGTPQTCKLMRTKLMQMAVGTKLKVDDPLTPREQDTLCSLLLSTKTERTTEAKYPDNVPIIQGGESVAFEGVLQKILFENEKLNGFHVDEKGHPQLRVYSFTGLISAKAFLKGVSDGYQWKDIGVSKDHGVFSHRIQWYLIANGRFLKAPEKTFSAIGNPEYVSELKDALGQMSLWARLCDRPNYPSPKKGLELGTVAETDLRSPERVTSYILAQKNRLPWLHASVQKGQTKYKDLFAEPSLQKQYHTRKTTGTNPRFADEQPGMMRRL